MAVVDLQKYKLKKAPITYCVEFTHDEEGLSFIVHDVKDMSDDRLKLAEVLEAAAQTIRNELDCPF